MGQQLYKDIPIQRCKRHPPGHAPPGDQGGAAPAVCGLHDRIPGLVLRTTVITGLPARTRLRFEELCGFLQEEKIQRAGAFPYSPEEGTPAD